MNYNNAIEKTILFIESHLTASFTVEDAAREAGYSYYHLNRQFSAVLGESVGSYIKKRRLSHAARELIYTERRIIDIALELSLIHILAMASTSAATACSYSRMTWSRRRSSIPQRSCFKSSVSF